jgi:prepilin-type N-terminal cleavage/methylation domain-containing protein
MDSAVKQNKVMASNAFTLTELLVAIATISVLAAILLPALSMAKDYSRSASCRNHLPNHYD